MQPIGWNGFHDVSQAMASFFAADNLSEGSARETIEGLVTKRCRETVQQWADFILAATPMSEWKRQEYHPFGGRFFWGNLGGMTAHEIGTGVIHTLFDASLPGNIIQGTQFTNWYQARDPAEFKRLARELRFELALADGIVKCNNTVLPNTAAVEPSAWKAILPDLQGIRHSLSQLAIDGPRIKVTVFQLPLTIEKTERQRIAWRVRAWYEKTFPICKDFESDRRFAFPINWIVTSHLGIVERSAMFQVDGNLTAFAAIAEDAATALAKLPEPIFSLLWGEERIVVPSDPIAFVIDAVFRLSMTKRPPDRFLPNCWTFDETTMFGSDTIFRREDVPLGCVTGEELDPMSRAKRAALGPHWPKFWFADLRSFLALWLWAMDWLIDQIQADPLKPVEDPELETIQRAQVPYWWEQNRRAAKELEQFCAEYEASKERKEPILEMLEAEGPGNYVATESFLRERNVDIEVVSEYVRSRAPELLYLVPVDLLKTDPHDAAQQMRLLESRLAIQPGNALENLDSKFRKKPEFALRELEDSPLETGIPEYLPLETAILDALDGRALKVEALAQEVSNFDTGVFYKAWRGQSQGVLTYLKSKGVIAHSRKMGGYYRPDAPPVVPQPKKLPKKS
jgi:hypothetical protein